MSNIEQLEKLVGWYNSAKQYFKTGASPHSDPQGEFERCCRSTNLPAILAEWQADKAIIEKLPRTKDGVVVTPAMSVWVDHGSDAYEEDRYEEGQWWPDESCDIYGDGEYIALADCYSTREAAVADHGEQK